MSKLRVTVLTGGTSAEREICLMSGRKVLGALDPTRYDALAIDLAAITGPRATEVAGILFAPNGCDLEASPQGSESSSPGASALVARKSEAPTKMGNRPDVVFVALHGGAGENGTVQGMLDLLGIPYTGSGVLASALALNKIMAKKVFEREGIPTPRWLAVESSQLVGAAQRVLIELGLPCVVKPACEGSSIGVTIVREEQHLEPALKLAFQYSNEALVEKFVPGTEITGPVLGNDDAQVLPLVEIIPSSGFYDYQAKYTAGATEEIVPARIPEATAERARELTLRAHHALGCRGMSRVDMIVAPDGEVYVLELQTIPGLTDTSLLPRSAQAAGISFPQLVDRLIELALEDKRCGDSGHSA